MVIALLAALVITGGTFASTAASATTTDNVTVISGGLASVSGGSIDWEPVALVTANITASTAFTITPNANISTLPNLWVHVFLLNAPTLTANYDHVNIKVDLEGTVTPTDDKILSLTNGEVVFKAAGLTGGSDFTVELTGGSYYCYDESGAVGPELWAEVKQGGVETSNSP